MQNPIGSRYTRYRNLEWWQKALVMFLPTREWAIFEKGWGVDPAMAPSPVHYSRLRGAERDLVVHPDYKHRMVAAHLGLAPEVLARDPSPAVRREVAATGLELDLLVDDPSDLVREQVALHGQGLGRLVDDESWLVRSAVAGQGYGLSKLIRDPDHSVRQEVARQGYGLVTLVADPDWRVRTFVAMRGYGLDRLVADPDPHVRRAVADMGFGLDALADDPCIQVRQAAEARLLWEDVTPRQWAQIHPDRCVETLGDNTDPAVRGERWQATGIDMTRETEGREAGHGKVRDLPGGRGMAEDAR